MTSKIILVAGVLTALASCAQPMSNYYPSRMNGLAVSSEENAVDTKKYSSSIDVNNREMVKVNNELKVQADLAERNARALGGKR